MFSILFLGVRRVSWLTCVWLFSCEDDPHHNGKAVHIGLFSRHCVYTLQVLGGHVAQRAGSPHHSWLPLATLPPRLLLGEFAPGLADGQAQVCNLGNTKAKMLDLTWLLVHAGGIGSVKRTLMWNSLSTKMFSGLMSLCMMCLSVRYTIASRISTMILPLTDIGTDTWKWINSDH